MSLVLPRIGFGETGARYITEERKGRRDSFFTIDEISSNGGSGKSIQRKVCPRTDLKKASVHSVFNLDETEGFQCLEHSNWTICSPLSPFCYEIFPTFSLSYWGAQSYYPKGLITRK